MRLGLPLSGSFAARQAMAALSSPERLLGVDSVEKLNFEMANEILGSMRLRLISDTEGRRGIVLAAPTTTFDRPSGDS